MKAVPAIRRVIGGRAYDSTTASVLYHDAYNDSVEVQLGLAPPCEIDAWLMENLYGHYFLVCDTELEDIERTVIKPLTREAAIAWAEENCQWLVEELFGVMPEAGQEAACAA
jgi:hypothetical protein